MEKLRNFFESKWAALPAFVPVVHLFYAIIAFLLRGADRFFFRVVNAFIVCAAELTIHFFPGYGWLVAYAALTALALVDLKSIRQSDYTFAKSLWLRIAVLALPVLLALSVLLSSLHLLPSDLFGKSEKDAFLGEQTRAVLETIIDNDPQGYKELEYQDNPYAAFNGYTLVGLRQALIEKDSLPEGEIGTMTLLEASISGSRACRTYGRTYEVVIGDGLYRVAVEYTEASDIAGFSRVNITKIG